MLHNNRWDAGLMGKKKKNSAPFCRRHRETDCASSDSVSTNQSIKNMVIASVRLVMLGECSVDGCEEGGGGVWHHSGWQPSLCPWPINTFSWYFLQYARNRYVFTPTWEPRWPEPYHLTPPTPTSGQCCHWAAYEQYLHTGFCQQVATTEQGRERCEIFTVRAIWENITVSTLQRSYTITITNYYYLWAQIWQTGVDRMWAGWTRLVWARSGQQQFCYQGSLKNLMDTISWQI